MVTSDELLQSLAESVKRMMDDGVAEFRENEDSVKLIKPNEYAALLSQLANETTQAAIDGSSVSQGSTACVPKGEFLL